MQISSGLYIFFALNLSILPLGRAEACFILKNLLLSCFKMQPLSLNHQRSEVWTVATLKQLYTFISSRKTWKYEWNVFCLGLLAWQFSNGFVAARVNIRDWRIYWAWRVFITADGITLFTKSSRWTRKWSDGLKSLLNKDYDVLSNLLTVMDFSKCCSSLFSFILGPWFKKNWA